MEYPNRKHPRLKYYDYSLPGYYYVTICAGKNQPPFSRIRATAQGAIAEPTAVGAAIQDQLLQLEQRYPAVTVDKYVIMPDHIHMILVITAPGGSALPAVIGGFKSLATKQKNALLGTPGEHLFQQSFYETILRNERAYQEAWRYIEENPAKWLYIRDGQRRGQNPRPTCIGGNL